MSKYFSSLGIAGFFGFSEWHSHSESKLGMNAGVSWVLRHCYMVLSRYYLCSGGLKSLNGIVQ